VKRVAVVGAGAAGLTAAIRAAEAGARVTLLNAHPKIGLKILMSGGTRCNVTHATVTERDYWGGSRAVIRRVLAAFTPEQTLEWFRGLGVELKLEETGKWFPVTDDADTVLQALLGRVTELGVEVQVGARVVRLERGDAGWRLGVQNVANSSALGADVSRHARDTWPLPDASPDRWVEADAVIVASGGLSFPRTGSDGTGYALLQALGHSLVPPVPALTPLAVDDVLCVAAQGVTLDAALTLWVDGRKEIEREGSLLIAHFGYSGPVALDLSRHWLRAEGRERRVTMSVLLSETRETLATQWQARAEHQPKLSVRNWLGAQLPNRLAEILCVEAGVDFTLPMSQVSRERRAALFTTMLERPAPVRGTLGYEKAEATAGGVPLAEVDPSTLESRKAPGLYLCGEVLDVDGRLGGFNFQWSWSSGTVAGRAAAEA
jgi:predicted flavoprotein YhiN